MATKPTFKQAFQSQRCLVPCNGWFERRAEDGKKVKYLFEREHTELVTLTTQPNDKCGQYHKRMSALVLAKDKDYWFNSPYEELAPLLLHVENRVINIERID